MTNLNSYLIKMGKYSYLQRAEPESPKDDPLTESEKCILFLYRKNKLLQNECNGWASRVDTMQNEIDKLS